VCEDLLKLCGHSVCVVGVFSFMVRIVALRKKYGDSSLRSE
jgi:hypothetical protein